MREPDAVSRTARAAIARAKQRSAMEVTPDDLLVAALREVSRFGIALIGPWTMELDDLDGPRGEGEAPADDAAVGDGDPAVDGDGYASGPARGPRYADETVALFEEAARLAGKEEDGTLRIVHLLAVLGDHQDGLMARLRARHDFTSLEWKAALARGELGPAGPDTDPGAARPGGPNFGTPELLSVDQAATFLGVHAQTVRNYIRAGKLPAYRLAGERFIRVLRRDLMGLLEPVAADDAQDGETELPLKPSPEE